MNNVTLRYRAAVGGAAQSTIQSLMASVPVPASVLGTFGLRVTSDSTATGTPVVRTIVLSFNPSSGATATAQLVPGDASGSPIRSFTVTAPGAGYVLPPIVKLSGGGGSGSGIVTTAAGIAFLKVVGASVASTGALYSAQTFAVVDPASPGGVPPSTDDAPSNPLSHAAKLTLTIVGGHITGVAIADAGAGYAGIPNVVIVDPTGAGSGGAISLSMGVERVDVARPGVGYESAPTVTLVPAFKVMFPDASDQRAPFFNLMTVPLSQAVLSPVAADTPVLS